MRRRRQKNTVLPKMIGIAVLINAILLPILAQMGAFKHIGGRHLTPVELVKLPPPAKKPVEPHHAKPKAAPHKAEARSTHPAPPNPNRVHVAVAPSTPTSDDNGPSVEQGTQAPGTIPTPTPAPAVAPPPTPAPVVTPPSPAPVPAPTPPAPAPPVPAPVVAPAPTPPPTPPPHTPVLVAAQPVSEIKPTVPDDLVTNDDNKSLTYFALFKVLANGTADVSTLHGTGDAKLDDLALNAAKRWTFKPATVDGKAVDSYLRLQVVFDVSS